MVVAAAGCAHLTAGRSRKVRHMEAMAAARMLRAGLHCHALARQRRQSRPRRRKKIDGEQQQRYGPFQFHLLFHDSAFGEARDPPPGILPGRVGFEEKGVITINPSYYPPHILRRFADYDPYWLPVLEGSINAMVRCSPSGVAPDWAKFDAQGRLVDPQKMEGSYNAIRTYLWSGILSPKDQNYEVLMRQYEPMINLVKATNIPPEKVNIGDMTVNNRQVNAFGACFLPYVAADKAGAVIRTVLTTTEMKGDNYYRNVLTVFGLGFDNRAYAFDEKGRLILPTDNMAVKTMTPRNE